MVWLRRFLKKPDLSVANDLKIEIISRHCIFSSISAHKKRFPGYSREICYRNLVESIDFEKANLTFLLDTAKGSLNDHFLREERRFPLVEIKEGSEAGSFLRLLDYVETLNLDPRTILYFVEDDYLHRPGWIPVLLEAFDLPGVDYATLYDHRDKYFLPMYEHLRSEIRISPTCHWRTIPSTTQTFAVRWSTLKKDLSLHRRYSTGCAISRDHDKFCDLTRRGAKLVSPLPGWSTHAEPEFSSPCVDWQSFLTPTLESSSCTTQKPLL